MLCSQNIKVYVLLKFVWNKSRNSSLWTESLKTLILLRQFCLDFTWEAGGVFRVAVAAPSAAFSCWESPPLAVQPTCRFRSAKGKLLGWNCLFAAFTYLVFRHFCSDASAVRPPNGMTGSAADLSTWVKLTTGVKHCEEGLKIDCPLRAVADSRWVTVSRCLTNDDAAGWTGPVGVGMRPQGTPEPCFNFCAQM